MIKISELQAKDVVNISDGKKLGQINDLELDLREGQIKALVVPSESRFFGLVTGGKETVIPWNRIVKIGNDVILVRLDNGQSYVEDSERSREPRPLLNSPFESAR
ncbi:sporulation protein, YlmC/YmxH family [Marininema mesophilum]|uniref:Sporulation protein, YlmC/YmxH family n=1 Tax=Marininema mesophilum TaxID=1048340 RepID=A0A1H2QD46_9BACL|nr:YlmC/YmxH family sporulation protein [Marininema mesophilum]SDW05052.1 sporulation protein, YlmC/YmxH family [Marininema mesophilum]